MFGYGLIKSSDFPPHLAVINQYVRILHILCIYIYIYIIHYTYIYIYLYIINNIYIYSINKLEKFIPPKMMINVIVFYLFLGGYDIHNPLSYISTNYPREVACIWLPPIGIIKYVIICPEPGIYLKIYLSFQLILCPRAIP